MLCNSVHKSIKKTSLTLTVNSKLCPHKPPLWHIFLEHICSAHPAAECRSSIFPTQIQQTSLLTAEQSRYKGIDLQTDICPGYPGLPW